MKIAHISVSDWGTSVAGMSLEEEGFYWRMTRLMYANDGVFPDNDRDNAEIMNINIRVYRRLKAVLLSKDRSRKAVIKITDGHIINRRVIEEIEKFVDAKKQAVERGHLGAEARWRDRRLGQVSLKFGPNLDETSAKLRRNSAPDSLQNKDLGMATPTPTPYSIEEETPVVPLTAQERRAARAKMDAALVPHEAEQQASVVWDDTGRIEVFNGFRAELLDKLGGTGLSLEDALAEAAGKVGDHLRGIPLMKAVRAEVTKVARWTKGDIAKRRGPPPSAQKHRANPDAVFMANQEAGMAIREHLWGRCLVTGKTTKEPAQ